MFFDELYENDTLEYDYPTDGINALYNAILLGDPVRIQFAVDILIKSMECTGSRFFATCLGYDIVNTSLRAMRELNYSFSLFSKKYPEMMLKSEFYQPYEIVDIIKKLSFEICEHISHQDFSSNLAIDNNSDISVMLDYIEHHFAEESFSVKTLSDHFAMSISNFSHYFKGHTGHVVSQHINNLRFEKAKELLRTTDSTIAEIITLSGYCHISTFMRQFKQMENMTPTFYRNMYRPLIK